MARSDEFFTPESVDEQIERSTHVAGGDYAKYNEVLNAHLIHQLHRHYRPNAEENKQHLEDAWHLLAQRRRQAGRFGYNGRAGPGEDKMSDVWPRQAHQQTPQVFEALPHSEPPEETSGRWKVWLLISLCIALACLLGAAAVIVFGVWHP